MAGKRPRLIAVSAMIALAAGEHVAATRVEAAPSVSAAAKAEAKSKLLEGADLMRKGDYPEALERFKTAYELVPSPKIHYNFGLAHMALGRPAEAIEFFDKFLAGAVDADPEHVAQAHRHRAALRKKVGRIIVTCPVNGAAVVIDGRPFGSTPVANAILLSPGPHFVLVEHPEGGSPFTHRVEITPGGSIELVVHLGPARGGTEPQRPPSIATEKRLAALTPVATRDDTRSLPPTRESAPPVWPRNVGWIAAGVAGASLAFATYEWSIKEGKFKEYNNKSNACGVVPPSQHCQNLVADGNRAKHLGLAGFIAGGAFAVGAVGLFLWSAGALDGSKPHHTALSCTSLLGDVGASCGWRF